MPDRQLDWAHALFQLGQELSLDNAGVVRQKLLDHIVAGFDAGSGSIALLDDDEKHLTLIAGSGSAAGFVGTKIPVGQRILGWVVKHGTAVYLTPDSVNDARFESLQLISTPDRPLSALCWPLTIEHRTIGAISVNRGPGKPRCTEQDLASGGAMVGMVSLVIDNLRTHAAYQRRIADLDAEKNQRAAAEARLTAILDSSDAILSVNADGCVTLFNRGAEAVFGYTAGEVLGQPVERLIPERFTREHPGQMRRFVESGQGVRILNSRTGIWGKRKNGDEFPAEVGIARVQHDSELSFTVTLRDISDRLQAEDKLQRLGRILDNTVNEIYVFDAQTQKFEQVNEGARRNLGYSMDEMRNLTPLDLKPEFTTQDFNKMLAQLAEGRENRTVFETVHRRKDGSLYPVEVRLQYSPQGAAPVYVAIIDDITERRKTQEAQKRLTAIVESSTDIIGTCAPDERILYLNAAGRAFMGLGETQPIDHLRIADFVPQWVESQMHHEILPYANRDGSWQGESELHSPAGQDVPVSILVLAHKDPDGRLLYFSAIVRDIAERVKHENELRARQRDLEAAYKDIEQAQSQLLQSEKMASVGQLAAGVAHEINNPVGFVNSNLGSLQNYVADLFKVIAAYEQLESTLPQNETLEQLRALKKKLDLDYLREDTGNLVKESIEGLGRVKKIVQDLKEFSHVDSAEWQIADLHTGLDSTLNIAHNELKYKTTVVKEYGKIPQVECIASQINQVFMNILVNAAHAIETRGTITIRTGAGNDAVWIEIADTGKGMPPDVLKRIFEPFFTTKPVGKGTGLGLSLTYGIMQKHHGRIEVESEPGKGTCFRIHLPVRQPEKKAAA